jgi:hypothetical protein
MRDKRRRSQFTRSQHCAGVDGKYFVRPESDDPSVVTVRGADGHGAAAVITIPRQEPALEISATTGLTFEIRDGEHVHARVVDGDGTERELVRVHSNNERAAASAAAER